MANDKQGTLPGVPEPPAELKTDRAIRALRDYQAGKVTSAYLRNALTELPPGSFLWVSLATRVPVGTLEKLAASQTS